MLRPAKLLLVLPVLGGCAHSSLLVNRAALLSFKGGSIAVTDHDGPAFAPQSTEPAATGEAPAAMASGHPHGHDSTVEDPARRIRDRLLGAMELHLGLTAVHYSPPARTAAGVMPVILAPAGADLLLDVQTTHWNYWYDPNNWAHYRVSYSAQVRVIDLHQSRVLVALTCTRESPQEGRAPTRRQMILTRLDKLKRAFLHRSQTERMKEELDTSAEHCVNALQALILPGTSEPLTPRT